MYARVSAGTIRATRHTIIVTVPNRFFFPIPNNNAFNEYVFFFYYYYFKHRVNVSINITHKRDARTHAAP